MIEPTPPTQGRPSKARSPLLLGCLVLALMIAVGQAPRWGSAQTQAGDDTADAGYRLVARVLPGEWTELAASVGTPEATPGARRSAPGAASAATGPLAGEALVAALRAGGYVIYFRHAATDRSDDDRFGAANFLRDCAAQRDLNDEGRSQSRAIGQAFRDLGIPVGDVLSSEYCRSRNTAELAFGEAVPTAELTSPFWDEAYGGLSADQKATALRSHLRTPPPGGTNRVLVAHGQNLSDAIGVDLGTEGEAAIFLPIADDPAPTTVG